MKFCVVVGLFDIVTHAKFGDNGSAMFEWWGMNLRLSIDLPVCAISCLNSKNKIIL